MAERCVPILPSGDLDESLESYARLGFDNRGAPPEERVELVVPDEATGSRIIAPDEREFGMLEFAVVDRSGNLLRVGSSV
jgi:hypothetical protein